MENISPVKHTLVDLRTPTNQLTAIKSRMLTNSERGSLMTLRNHQVINDYKQICEQNKRVQQKVIQMVGQLETFVQKTMQLKSE